jgi:hypothetical protein
MKTLRKTMIALSIAIFGSLSAHSQSMLGDINGRVSEDETKEGLFNVIVRAFRAGEQAAVTATDMDGYFSMKALQSGSYNLQFTCVGKDTLLITGVEVNADKVTWRQNITMKDRSELKGVVVMADAIPLINPDDPSAVTVGFKELKNSPNLRDMSKLISGMTTDVKTSVDGGDAYVRGSRSSSTVYFVDGVKQREMAKVPGAAIGKITVYTGGVPAKYGDTTGGVIILETKSYFDLYNERNAGR